MRITIMSGERIGLAMAVLGFGVLPACSLFEKEETVAGPNLPPTVSITAPSYRQVFASGDVIKFDGTSSDPEDGRLGTSQIVWTSDLDGELGRGIPFESSSLSDGAHTITLTGTDNAGNTHTTTGFVYVFPPSYGGLNLKPVATIARPGPFDVFPLGQPIVFEGSAIDPEDGLMPEDALRWILVGDGAMGSGSSLTQSDLPVGEHQIWFHAVDAYGAEAVQEVFPWVYEPAAACSAGLSLDENPVEVVPGGVATVLLGIDKERDSRARPQLWAGPVHAVEDVLEAHAFEGGWKADERVISLQVRDDVALGSRYSLELAVYVQEGTISLCRVPIELEVVAGERFNALPTAMIEQPVADARFDEYQLIYFNGSGTDPGDGDLAPAALSWSSNLDGPMGTGRAILRADLSVGTHVITLTATDSGGLSSGTSVTIEISGNAPPVPAITSPADGSIFTVGELIDFQGTATDTEDGDLTGASLAWTSSLDGPIGTSRAFLRSDLSEGDHRITLSATDSRGSVGSTSVDITVRPPAAPTSLIAGAVIFARTPLPDITVTLSGDADATQTTTIIGQFLFMDLAAGTYTVTISNYPTYANFPFTSQTVTLGDGERASIIFRAP